jgi:chromosome segregation ATPase
LSNQKSKVGDLKKEINRLKRIVEDKEIDIESLRCENRKLVDHYRGVADDEEKTLRKEKLSLDKQIEKNKKDILSIEKEKEELTRKKNDIENEVELKSNVICKRDKEITEKELEVWNAIEESNGLRLKIDILQQQHSETKVKDQEMSKKIEILEDELAEKENTIKDLRENKTMKREEVVEEMGNIAKGHEKKLEDMSEKIDLLTDTLMKVLKEKK